jgi:hypothetical protein
MKKTFEKWYAELAANHKWDPNPNDPRHFYDYKAAWNAGASVDEYGHMPSRFKHDLHPNRFIREDPDGNKLPKGKYWDTKSSKTIVDKAKKSKFDLLRNALLARMDDEDRERGSGF